MPTISEDAIADEVTGLPFYRARIQLEDTDLRNVLDNYRLLPGMTTSAEIKIGQRSVLSYFFYPSIRGLDESLKGALTRAPMLCRGREELPSGGRRRSACRHVESDPRVSGAAQRSCSSPPSTGRI